MVVSLENSNNIPPFAPSSRTTPNCAENSARPGSQTKSCFKSTGRMFQVQLHTHPGNQFACVKSSRQSTKSSSRARQPVQVRYFRWRRRQGPAIRTKPAGHGQRRRPQRSRLRSTSLIRNRQHKQNDRPVGRQNNRLQAQRAEFGLL